MQELQQAGAAQQLAVMLMMLFDTVVDRQIIVPGSRSWCCLVSALSASIPGQQAGG